jgi:hypothetical protein
MPLHFIDQFLFCSAKPSQLYPYYLYIVEYEEYSASCDGKDTEGDGRNILEGTLYKLAWKDCVKPRYNLDTLPSFRFTYKAPFWLVLGCSLVRISAETSSILNWKYCGFHLSPRHIAGIAWIRPRPLPSTSSSIHYSLIILPFVVIYVQLRRVTLRGVYIQFRCFLWSTINSTVMPFCIKVKGKIVPVLNN